MANEAAVTTLAQVGGDIIDWEDINNRVGATTLARVFSDETDLAEIQKVQRAVRDAESLVKAGAGKHHAAYLATITPATAHQMLKRMALDAFELYCAERIENFRFSFDIDARRTQIRLEVNDLAMNKTVLDGVSPSPTNVGGLITSGDPSCPDPVYGTYQQGFGDY